MGRSGGNIVLTGFMGTGKTVVGQAVAQALGREFIDMDEVIERQEGISIPEIFAQHGEPYFRVRERELCQELARLTGLVIATGGGALIPEENLRALAETGIVICLTCDSDEILCRLVGDDSRPMLWGADRRLGGPPELARRIGDLLAQRKSAYARMPHHIDTTRLSVEEAVSRALALSDAQLRASTPKATAKQGPSDRTTIPVSTPSGKHEIVFGEGVLRDVGQTLTGAQVSRRVAVVADENAWRFHGDGLERSLSDAGFDPQVIVLGSGEQHKTLETVSSLYDRFIAGGLDRHGAVLAFGGGVTGDIAGFAAATYLRGVPLSSCLPRCWPWSIPALAAKSV